MYCKVLIFSTHLYKQRTQNMTVDNVRSQIALGVGIFFCLNFGVIGF